MNRSQKMLALAATAAIAHFSSLRFANAASFTWDGGGANDNLNLGANWVGDVAPTVGDIAFFTGNVRTTPVVDVATQYLGVNFLATADAFTLGGTSTLTFGASPTTGGSIINNSALTQTFNAPVAFYAGSISAAAGNLTFGGPINIGNGGTVSGNSLTFTGTFTTTVNGALTSVIQAGSTSLVKTGTGTLIVNSSNAAYTGNVAINGGAVRINNGDAFGTGGGTISTSATSGGTGQGALELVGGITVSKNVLTLPRQDATVNNVMLRNISGSNTVQNVFTATGGNTFNYESLAGTLTIQNYTTTGSGGGRNLRLLGDGNGEIQNWTPAANAAWTVSKFGGGTWLLRSGMSAGTFTNLTVNGGTLLLENGLGSRVTGSATILTGGTLVVQSPDGTAGEIGTSTTAQSITVQNGGTFDASSFSGTYSLQPGPSAGATGQSLILGGTFKAGTLAGYGDNPIWIGNSTAAGAGTATVVGNLSLTNAFAAPNGGVHFDLSNDTTVGGGINDLLSIQGNLLVDAGSGAINLYLNPTAATLATGTYRLIEFTGGGSLNPSDFALQGFSPTTTRQTLSVATAPGQVNLSVSGNSANLVWKGGNGNNDWDVVTTENWQNGADPTDFFYIGDSVTFNDPNANTTVNLVGTLIPGGITVDTSQDYVFQGSGTLTGSAALTKTGTGRLIIANSGENTLAGTITINGGTLQIGNGGADGSLGSGSIVNNANLVIDKGAALTLANPISGTGQLIKRNTGALTLSGTNTYTGATTIEGGSVQINNGAALGDAVAGTSVASGAQLFSVANITLPEPLTLAGDGPAAGDGALRAGGSTTSTFNGTIALASAATLKVDGGATMVIAGGLTGTNTDLTLTGDGGSNGNLVSPVSLGTGGIIKNGPGTWTLANASISYSGNTSINAGVLQYGNGTTTGDATLPTGAINLTGGTIAFNNTGSYAVSANISGTGGVAVGNGGGTATLTGNLTGFTGMLTTLNGGTNSMLVVPVATGATAVQITDVNLTGVGQGIIRLTNSSAVANTATLDIQTSQAAGTGRLEVGNSVNLSFGSIILHPRNNLTATILSTDGNNTINGPMRINTGGTTVNFQANAGASLTFTGEIRPAGTGEGDVPGSSRALLLSGDGNGTLSGNVTNRPDAATTVGILLIKSGAGTWRLTGNNDYIGNVSNGALPANAANIVQQGRLVLVGSGAHVPVLNNTNVDAYTDIQGGRLVFDYTGGSTVGPAVLAILDAGWDQSPRFSSGKIRTTNPADPNRAIGWYDDTAASQVIVGYTYLGDTNLDGQVDITDLGNLATSWQTVGGWGQGDVDYSGFIDITDLGALATNWQAGVGNPLGPSFSEALAAVGLGGATVPEPATMALAGLCVAGLLSRRSRR